MMITHAPTLVHGIGGSVLTGIQVINTLTAFQNELNPTTRCGYSKFASSCKKTDNDHAALPSGVQVSSRTGMLIIYTPALLFSLLVLCTNNIPFFSSIVPKPTPAAILCALHFAKRDAEVLFLHRYSGNVALSLSAQIGVFYFLGSVLTCFVSVANPDPMVQLTGLILFAVGLAGNFFHHFLLASLRSDTTTSTKAYRAPRGGLFEYVAAPHYLFELIGWLGIAVVSWHGNVFLVFTGMCSYLGGRAWAQNDWNKKTFPSSEWPDSRKCLIPFVF